MADAQPEIPFAIHPELTPDEVMQIQARKEDPADYVSIQLMGVQLMGGEAQMGTQKCLVFQVTVPAPEALFDLPKSALLSVTGQQLQSTAIAKALPCMPILRMPLRKANLGKAYREQLEAIEAARKNALAGMGLSRLMLPPK